jgi:leader peptidase (prepilin peptidase) / N-methyltransferase
MLLDGTMFCLLVAAIREPWLPLWALELLARSLLGAWLFYFGACVGSFLNVVVYRLPRGLNLVHPGSRCPQCGHAIRVRDNLPIFGWLLLGGRCRDCRSPISPRYYFVELVTGLIFLLVAVFEAFLPVGERTLSSLSQPLPFWSSYALHMGLAATLLAATLMEYDGIRVPWKLFIPELTAAVVLPAIWPRIRPVPLAEGLQLPAWLLGLADGLAGLGAGLVLGLVVGVMWWLGCGRQGWPKFAPAMLLATVGSALGWQRVVELAPAAMLVYAIGVAATSRTSIVFPLAAMVLASVLLQLVQPEFSLLKLSDLARPYDQGVTVAATIGCGLLALVAGRVAGPQYFTLPAFANQIGEPRQP